MNNRHGAPSACALQPLLALLPGLLLLPSACAHTYVDTAGARHVIGLVHLSIHPASPPLWGGEALRVRSVGVTLNQGAESHALVIGYSDATHALVRNNALVAAEALRPDGPGPAKAPPDQE
jgi:hypothetical protein